MLSNVNKTKLYKKLVDTKTHTDVIAQNDEQLVNELWSNYKL